MHVFSREQVKANVFKSRMAGPTISIEEYGDMVKAEMEAQSNNTINEEDKPILRYLQLEAEGLEDDDELVDKAMVKDRAWDAWKEDNPKGWGNKMGKRY